MNHETLSSNPEGASPLKRFDELLAAMPIEINGGWQELPSVAIIEPTTRRAIPVQFWVFSPKPLGGSYETASYSPSIMMEAGERKYDESGKLVRNVSQVFVRRDFLDESSPLSNNNHERAVQALAQIEEVFEIYKKAIKASEPSE